MNGNGCLLERRIKHACITCQLVTSGHTQIVQTDLRRITGMLNKLKLKVYLCSSTIKLKGLLGACGPRICQICLSSAVQL